MSSTSLFKWMGLGQQSGKTAIDNDSIDEGERYFGLENFGNTCYSNSVVQALYFCKPFRQCVLNYPQQASSTTLAVAASSQQQLLFSPTSNTNSNSPMVNGNSSSSSYFPSMSSSTSSSPAMNGTHTTRANGGTSTPSRETAHTNTKLIRNNTANGSGTNTPGAAAVPIEKDQNNINLAPGMEDTLFSSLKDLFWKISTNKKKAGVIAPVNFINKVKKENELFRSSMHQDAHEFLNYVLNTIADDVQKYQQKIDENENSIHSETETSTSNSSTAAATKTTWVHQLFEGVFSNETKCLSCETVTSRDECFMDLSIDVEMNSSVTSCLRQFSASETLCHKNKYFCDVCSGLQEAERRMKIKKLPNILALHLKRFKYQEQLQKYIKLTYRVVFPLELRLFNTSDDTEDADRMYELWAIVVHIGSGPHHGHYVAIIKSNGQWMLFDDDVVTQIQEDDIQKYFSDLPGSGSGYVLFYQAVDLNMDSINISTSQGQGQGGLETVKEDNTTNGRPITVSSQHPTMPLRIDNLNLDNTAAPPRREDFVAADIPTPETTPPPPPTQPVVASAPAAPDAPVPVVEEKKTRWGLGRKIRGEKKDKK